MYGKYVSFMYEVDGLNGFLCITFDTSLLSYYNNRYLRVLKRITITKKEDISHVANLPRVIMNTWRDVVENMKKSIGDVYLVHISN